MRIIGGYLGGRQFDAPKGRKTHPMGDRVRGALFNALGDIEDLAVLDAFAGSGAIAFEAISRGAESVLAIESDPQAQAVIAKNVKHLGIDAYVRVVKATNQAWLRTTQDMFDIVICDPPYQEIKAAQLTALASRVKPDGIFVLSLPPNETLLLENQFNLLERKSYGDALLYFYKKVR